MYVLAQISLWAQCNWDAMGVCKISQVFPLVLKFHSNLLTYQVIGLHLTANFRQQNVSYHNVSICVTSPRYNNSFEKPGSILMHTHESFRFPSPSLPVLIATDIDAFVNSKGLDARQTAFAIKKYKSHHRVGLTSEIVALMQASDWCSTYIQTPLLRTCRFC